MQGQRSELTIGLVSAVDFCRVDLGEKEVDLFKIWQAFGGDLFRVIGSDDDNEEHGGTRLWTDGGWGKGGYGREWQ